MASKDDYNSIAQEIANFMNAYRLAFRTYHVDDLDNMMTLKAGSGARLSTKTNAEEFETVLLRRGFRCYPPVSTAKDGGDGYVRIYRTNTAVANILEAFLNPGQNGDQALRGLLRRLWSNRPDERDELDEGTSNG